MSFYRSLLAAVAAFALALPAFADEAPATTEQSAQPAQAAQAAQPMQLAQNAEPAQPMQLAAQSTDTQAMAPQNKVDINKASVKDLIKLKGMTAAKAKAIIAYRKKNGDFKSLEDLKNVKGFKKMNSDQMKDLQDQLTAG